MPCRKARRQRIRGIIVDATFIGKIGIMGGTFDPVHYGHLLIAQSAAEEFGLDQVIFLPTGKSPHKPMDQVTDAGLRCKMLCAALKGNAKFSVSTMETDSDSVNYTYRSLQKFHQAYPKSSFYFIMGEDSLDDFPGWRNPAEICRLASVLVAVRGDSRQGMEEKMKTVERAYSADLHLLHAPSFSVSSSEIRSRVKQGRSVRYMLPDEVWGLIEEHSLYKGFGEYDRAVKQNQKKTKA